MRLWILCESWNGYIFLQVWQFSSRRKGFRWKHLGYHHLEKVIKEEAFKFKETEEIFTILKIFWSHPKIESLLNSSLLWSSSKITTIYSTERVLQFFTNILKVCILESNFIFNLIFTFQYCWRNLFLLNIFSNFKLNFPWYLEKLYFHELLNSIRTFKRHKGIFV